MTPREELFELVKRIPHGRVVNYGAAGDALSRRMTGRTVGQCMATCPQNVPWWRVVAKDGSLPVGKRDPVLGQLQEKLLRDEGVVLIEGHVDMDRVSIDLDTI